MTLPSFSTFPTGNSTPPKLSLCLHSSFQGPQSFRAQEDLPLLGSISGGKSTFALNITDESFKISHWPGLFYVHPQLNAAYNMAMEEENLLGAI